MKNSIFKGRKKFKKDSKQRMLIDEKIKKLHNLTSKFLFIEYYTHTGESMYKILNEFTKYKEEKLVLCSLDEGIDIALDFALKHISKCKEKFLKEGGE